MKSGSKGYVLLELIITLTLALIFIPSISRMFSSASTLLNKTSLTFQARTFLSRKAHLCMILNKSTHPQSGFFIMDNRKYQWRKDATLWNAEKNLYMVKLSLFPPQGTDETYSISFLQKM